MQSTMKKRQQHWSLRLFIGLILIFSGLFAVALATGNQIVFLSTKIAVVPVVLTLYFSRIKYMPNLFFSVFLLFFLGHALEVVNDRFFSDTLSKCAYLASYSLLILVLIKKIKHVKFEGLVSLYLVFVCLLNSYFLYVFYDVVRDNFTSNLDMVFYILKSTIMIGMCFLAFTVYLSQETKQSIIFLAMSFCFVFADVLHYVTDLYVYYWLFDWMGNSLQLVGLFVLLTYVTNHNGKISLVATEKSLSTVKPFKSRELKSEVTQ